MAQSFQNVTLSLTLPISCQICLGKVRQPVICCNNHVFCSNCIKVWLEKSSQCPTCRVAITSENPCREIIGGTTESESAESCSVKRRLRKTRGELLLREYEDEIQVLLKENEDLKSNNLSLERQLKSVEAQNSTASLPTCETSSVELSVLEESANKLRATNDLYKKVSQDLDRLKEANKTLRTQNFDLIQENMRLKAEVDNRSPQKFGRYTVAALEAKIQQYERDVAQLKRALERSDKYIEEMEAQNQRDGSQPKGDIFPSTASRGTASGGVERIALMRRSLSAMEETSVCTNLEQKCTGLPQNHGLLTTSDMCKNSSLLDAISTPQKDEVKEATVPSTPSSALRSLCLQSPVDGGDRKSGLKPLTYLRKLSFDDCQGSSTSSSISKSPGAFQLCSGGPFSQKPTVNLDKGGLCPGWMDCRPELPKLDETTDKFKRPENPSAAQDPTVNSEACMDAAYLDKISELDFMMAEGEGSNSQVCCFPMPFPSSRSPDFDATQIAELDFSSNLLSDPGTPREHQTEMINHSGLQNAATKSDEQGLDEFSEINEGVIEMNGQSIKRKCQSGLATSSPSKLSKLK